nr:uncharacterized protein LOC109172074 [Ipomoea batatas]
MASAPEKATPPPRNDSAITVADDDVLRQCTAFGDREIGRRESLSATADAPALAIVTDSADQPPALNLTSVKEFPVEIIDSINGLNVKFISVEGQHEEPAEERVHHDGRAGNPRHHHHLALRLQEFGDGEIHGVRVQLRDHVQRHPPFAAAISPPSVRSAAETAPPPRLGLGTMTPNEKPAMTEFSTVTAARSIVERWPAKVWVMAPREYWQIEVKTAGPARYHSFLDSTLNSRKKSRAPVIGGMSSGSGTNEDLKEARTAGEETRRRRDRRRGRLRRGKAKAALCCHPPWKANFLAFNF